MATAGHSDSGAHGNSTFRRANSGEDREFDAEVARFLETEFFATANGNSSGVMSFQPTADKSGAISVNEDLVFMDFIESIEMSDPELERVNEPSEDVHMSDDTVSSSSRHPAITATITTSENLQPTSSLQVVIPASALAIAAPAKKLTVHRQRRSVKKTGPPRPKVKKERKRVKDEIEHLRQQVTALEEKLDKLQLGSVEEEEVSDLPLPGLCEGQRTDTESQTTTTWESIAKRQELEKQKSKVVNLQLRKMVKNQLWLAKGLSSLLHSQQDITNLCDVSSHDESTFETLAAQVEGMYSEVGTALDMSVPAGLDLDVKADADGNVHIEFGLLTDVVLGLYHHNLGVVRQVIKSTIRSDAAEGSRL